MARRKSRNKQSSARADREDRSALLMSWGRFAEWTKLPDRGAGVCKQKWQREQDVQRLAELSAWCVWGPAREPGWLKFGLCGMEWQKPRLRGWKRPMSSQSPFPISSFSISEPKCPWCSHPSLARETGLNLFELKERRSRMETGQKPGHNLASRKPKTRRFYM